MVASLLFAVFSQFPSVDCSFVSGTVYPGPVGPFQFVSCPSPSVAGPGTCPAGQFVTATGAGVTCDTPPAAPLTATPSTPSRSFNSNFTPSATKAVFVSYSVTIACTASLSGGQSATVELRSDTNATPTTVRAAVANANSVSLAIALTAVNTQTSVLSYVVPAGHSVRLAAPSAGGTVCTTSIAAQTEVALD